MLRRSESNAIASGRPLSRAGQEGISPSPNANRFNSGFYKHIHKAHHADQTCAWLNIKKIMARAIRCTKHWSSSCVF